MDIIPNRAIQHRSRPTPTGDTYTYNRTPDTASLRVDLTRFRDPDEAADRLLLACDELASLLVDQEDYPCATTARSIPNVAAGSRRPANR